MNLNNQASSSQVMNPNQSQPGGYPNILEQFNNNIDSELMNKYRSAQIVLEKITQQFEDYIPANKQLFGFPINLPFISVEKIWEEIKQRGIHEILQTYIEYVLDVRCFHYPNFIISVWIFVGVMYDE